MLKTKEERTQRSSQKTQRTGENQHKIPVIELFNLNLLLLSKGEI